MEMMGLRLYIKLTIEDICLGILDARDSLKEQLNNCPVAPANLNGNNVAGVEKITFDIAVTTEQTSGNNTNVGFAIKVLNATKEKGTVNVTNNINRVQFSVPFYPQALSSNKD